MGDRRVPDVRRGADFPHEAGASAAGREGPHDVDQHPPKMAIASGSLSGFHKKVELITSLMTVLIMFKVLRCTLVPHVFKRFRRFNFPELAKNDLSEVAFAMILAILTRW